MQSAPTGARAVETVVDAAEVARSTVKADHKVVIAENLQLTEAEGIAFWPLCREYRLEIERANDTLVELVLEYADLYPSVPDDRARGMLKKYTALEKRLVDLRAKHLKKIGKVLPVKTESKPDVNFATYRTFAMLSLPQTVPASDPGVLLRLAQPAHDATVEALTSPHLMKPVLAKFRPLDRGVMQV